MCASINDKNCNYRPYKSFITQNHLLIYGKKHREKIRNTGKTQGILSRLECGHPVLKEPAMSVCFSIADLDATIKKKLECTTCGKAFIQQTNLKKHMLTHTKVCGRRVSRKSSLKTHVRKRSVCTSTICKTSYQCATCSKFFTTRRDLKAHSLVHSGGRGHQCTVCD